MTATRHICAAAVFAALAVSTGATPRAAEAPLPTARPQTDARQRQWQDVIRNLRHPDPRVRLAAVETLGNSGYIAAAEPLAPLVNDPDDRVQFAAIDAEVKFYLSEPIGNPHIQSLADSKASRAQEAFNFGPFARGAAPAPPWLVDALITAVRDDNARIRFDAIHAVGVIAQSPLTPGQIKGIIDQLDHYEPVIRAATARVIGRLRIREAGDGLIAGMNDSSPIVQQYAIESLGLIHEERAVTSLLEFFKHYAKGELAANSLLALARIGHASSRDVFRERLTDGNPAMRRAAVEGLGRLADRDSLGQLHSMVQADPSAPVRLAAAFAVWHLGEPRLAVLVAGLFSNATSGQAADYLLELGSAAVAAVQAALGTTVDARERTTLIHLLGFIGGADTVPALQPFVKDKDPRVARAASTAIARLSK